MLSDEEFHRLCSGGFVRVTLVDGPTLQGYAATDPDDGNLLRVDGFAFEEDGMVSEFSVRLRPSQIETGVTLGEAPEVADPNGRIYRMKAAFFDRV